MKMFLNIVAIAITGLASLVAGCPVAVEVTWG
jgi:hypothetical protein